MRTKKFFYNSLTSAILQFATLIAGLIVPRLMLLTYGSEINGLVTSISQFISYFTLVEAGLSNAAIYGLYKPLAERNQEKINGVVSAANRYYITSGYIFLGLVLIFALVYPLFIKIDILDPFFIGLLVLILGTTGVLDFFIMSKYRVLLTADQRSYIISLASIASLIINTLIIIVLTNLKINRKIVK